MALNGFDAEKRGRDVSPVSLPVLNLPNISPETEAADRREAAERAAVTKTIRQGRDAWERIGDSNSFTAWCRIGAALAIGKAHALKVTGANAPWGRNYSREFSDWIKRPNTVLVRLET